jgi:hypothetical protein
LRLPYFLDNRLTDGVSLSVLRAGRFLPPGRFLVLISVRGCVEPRAIVRLEGLGKLKNPVTSRWGTVDLPFPFNTMHHNVAFVLKAASLYKY